MNTIIDNIYILDTDRQSYLYNPNVHAVKLANMQSFEDTNEIFFDTVNSANSNAICFSGSVNEHTQKLSNNTYKLNINNGSDIYSSALNYVNLRIDAFLYHYWIYDQELAFAYRCIGLVRLYEPTANNFITTCEAHDVGGSYSLKIRYNYGIQITLDTQGKIVVSDENPINVQQLTMQQVTNSINTLPVRRICSLPGLSVLQWKSIYQSVGLMTQYGQYIAQVVNDYVTSVQQYWFCHCI
ncbi:MAG: hypothetical protein EZS28_005465 [Streblomastix strix]|uniref:Uncharacterized protein n=1 Tax=Streblomastix strix TaxID=222440 RepID=A0A5J4WWX0_9EUKA|nr:MAG: hypothetical protein EZS28_005465 [Streblomastix strix]